MASSDQIGPPVDWSPVQPPAREPIVGERVRLEPFAEEHRDALYESVHAEGDPNLWRYMFYGPFTKPEWDAWFAANAATDDPLFYAVVDRSGTPVGQMSYLRIEPAMGVIEIGQIALGPALQRTPAATEAVYLMARHAFDDLGYRRFEWKTDSFNARSRRAAERLGFTFEGIFRQHMVVKGRNRDTAWFAMLDGEWPAIRAKFEAWLDPSNFSPDGRQLTPLRAAPAPSPVLDPPAGPGPAAG